MLKIYKRYFSNKLSTIFGFIIIPIVFISIENNNILFLTWMSFNGITLHLLADFRINSTLPISRKDIIKGSYLFMITIQTLLITYFSLIVYFSDKFLGVPEDGQFRLNYYLAIFTMMSFYALIVYPLPLYLASKGKTHIFDVNNKNIYWITMPVALLIFPFLLGTTIIENFNIYILTTISILVSIFNWTAGYLYSVKKIESIDF